MVQEPFSTVTWVCGRIASNGLVAMSSSLLHAQKSNTASKDKRFNAFMMNKMCLVKNFSKDTLFLSDFTQTLGYFNYLFRRVIIHPFCTANDAFWGSSLCYPQRIPLFCAVQPPLKELFMQDRKSESNEKSNGWCMPVEGEEATAGIAYGEFFRGDKSDCNLLKFSNIMAFGMAVLAVRDW